MKTKLDIDIQPYYCLGVNEDSEVAIDCELFGMNGKKLHRANSGTFAIITACTDGKTVYYQTDWKEIPQFLRFITLENPWIIFQKGDFDIRNFRRLAPFPKYKKYLDTMYLERIMNNGRYESFALGALCRRYLGLYMEKDTRNLFEKSTELTEEMLFYSCQDAAATWLVWQEQKKVISETEKKLWFEIDQPTVWAILDMPGIKVDKAKWQEMGEINREAMEKEKEKFPFNPASPQQSLAYFKKEEKAKIKDTNAESLEKLGSPMALRVVEYRKLAKLAGTYGLNWIEEHIEENDEVFTSWDVSRATTGRMSSSTPNLQNVPVREHPEFRDCFIAKDGMIFVIGDYSTQEPRCLCYISKDEVLLQSFLHNRDVYIDMAWTILGKHITKDDPIRKQMKKVFLAVSYGMTPRGLAKELEIDAVSANEMIEGFFEKYPGVGKYAKNQQKCQNYVVGALGRKIWVNPYNSQFPMEVLNAPIQSSASEMTKRAIVLVHRNWPKGIPFGLVLQVHDELTIEVPEKFEDEGRKFLNACMMKAAEYVTPGIPAHADIYTGKTWGAKK